jgi:quinol-cytochrome oxidoreductase complex cytochrome b subunit
MALALFAYVLLSGIWLAFPFDVQHPYASVSSLMVTNPWAAFIRNLHFWSAQLFLVFSLLHLYDHYRKQRQTGLKPGIGFRLSLGVLVIFLVMLTGFLLKGDADSQQARQILQTLLQRFPVAGKLLAFSFLGKPGSFGLIYVHHIATLTIFIAVIIVEHSRKFWPGAKEFVLTFVGLALLSWLFSAPLHDNMNPAVKGPWYFVGFQEILHWFSHPEWALLWILLLLVLIYLANSGREKSAFLSKRILLGLMAFYFVLTLIGMFFRGQDWRWGFPWQKDYGFTVLHSFKTERVVFKPDFSPGQAAEAPLIMGKKESCVVCHHDVHGFSASHNPKTIGCFSCHGGNPFVTDKKQAHKKMILIPGNLSTAERSCGTAACHPDITQRINTGLMATLSGMISVDRTVFGEQNNPDSLTDIHHLGNSAADEHLRNLCVRCHLGNPKTTRGPVSEASRGGGCLACHLNYSGKADSALQRYKNTSTLSIHPSLDLNISDNHCFGCHSRSGRISTNYEGWHETPLLPAQMPDSAGYRLVEGTRVFKKEPEDIHHQLGMQCIDCHTSYELMGDGKRYRHEENQEKVQCTDCHFPGKPLTVNASQLENEPAVVAALRYGKVGRNDFLITRKGHHALINTRVKGDTAWLTTKLGKKQFRLHKPDAVCLAPVHSDVSCSACHSAWAPSCVGCHNKYDPDERGYDMVANKEKKGSWVEYTGQYLAQLPALGVRTLGTKKEIIPVIPGMILTIDRQSFTRSKHDSLLFRRLFAPAAPHTTAVKGRSCKSCHNNPVALGFGKGKLRFQIKNGRGRWTFVPEYQNNPHDGLPEDAWTGFLKSRTGMVSTRKNVKPFSVAEQKKMLRVGACLSCHKENSAVMRKSLYDFDELLKKRSAHCILPDWK